MSALGAVSGAARRDPLLAGATLLLALATIAPLWVGRYVPLLDYPNQLSMSFVWFHLHDPGWNFAHYYELNPIPLPYWAQYVAVYALSLLVRPELGHKLFVTVAVLALPAAVAVYARRVGRDPRLALFAFPLAWNFNLAQGFIAYVGGLPVLFLALAALDAHAEAPSLRRGALAAVAGASLYFFHLLAFFVFLVVGGASALLGPRRPTPLRAILAALPTVPALVVGAVCWRLASAMQSAGPVHAPSSLSSLRGLYYDIAGVLSQLPSWLIDVHPGQTDELVLVLLALVWVLLLAARPLVAASARVGAAVDGAGALDPPAREWRAWRVELAAAVAFLLLFLLPRSLIQPFYWYAVSRRVGVVFALLAVCSIRGRLDGARRPLLLAVPLLGVLFAVDVAVHFRAFNARARDYDAVMERVPRGDKVLPLVFTDTGPDVNVRAYAHWGTWVQIRQGGYMLYALDTQIPVRYRRQLPAPPWDRPAEFRCDLHLDAWDWVLLKGPMRGVDPFAACPERVRRVEARGDWQLWQKLR